jgi:hypothetical protein
VNENARGIEGVRGEKTTTTTSTTCVTDTDKKIRDAADSLDIWKYIALYYFLDNSY